jgi:hypothetical protein
MLIFFDFNAGEDLAPHNIYWVVNLKYKEATNSNKYLSPRTSLQGLDKPWVKRLKNFVNLSPRPINFFFLETFFFKE